MKMGTLLPLLACLAALLCTVQAGREPTEVSSSVILINFSDMEVNTGNNLTLCEQQVWNSAKGFNARKINFVPTIQAIGSLKTIEAYYYKSGYDDTRIAASKQSIERYRAGLRRCFKAAIDAGFTNIHMVPHVDPFQASGRYVWRNLVQFHPLTPHGPNPANAFSYFDVVLKPAAEALNAVITNETDVDLAVSAEQGASIFAWPQEWRQTIKEIRAILGKGKDTTNHRIGVSFNWNKVCGCVEPEESNPIVYNATYLQRFERFKKAGGLEKIDLKELNQLFDEVDHLGCSGYANLPHNGTVPTTLTPGTMERSIETVAFEFASFGVNLTDLLLRKNKQFFYSEQGLGGCTATMQIAPNITFVAQHPFWGNWPWNGYTKKQDPWQNPIFRKYRQDVYSNLTAWALTGGGPQYRVDGIFVWSVGSFDVHAVFPSSTTKEGSFGDPVIQEMIRKANAEINGIPNEIVPRTFDKILPQLPRPENFTVPWDPPPSPKQPPPDTTLLGKPASPSPKPASPSPKPAAPATKPAKPSPKPASPSPKPAALATKPAKPSPKPASPSPKPAAPATKPAKPSPKPASPSPKPAGPSAKPAAAPKPPAPKSTGRPVPPSPKPAASPSKPPPSPAKQGAQNMALTVPAKPDAAPGLKSAANPSPVPAKAGAGVAPGAPPPDLGLVAPSSKQKARRLAQHPQP